MKLLRCFSASLALLVPPLIHAEEPVSTSVESSLKTDSGHIRQFVFDGDPGTFFRSTETPKATDHLTIRFDREIDLKGLKFTTGAPDTKDGHLAANIEISRDGSKFEPAGSLKGDTATWDKPEIGKVKAVRITPKGEQKSPMIVREVAIESTPALHPFRYPVEIETDTTKAPELKEWAEKVAKLCEKWYPRINEEFASEGFKPTTSIKMIITPDYNGVAMAGGNRITGATKWFKAHPEDLGAMIHETTHIVQRYRGRGNPGWLVEGVADYFRFFIYEPGKIGRIARDPHYNQAYRTTAAFLKFVTDKYDKDLVKKLNKAMREGTYKDQMFKDLTGKTLPELDEEWRTSLGIKKAA